MNPPALVDTHCHLDYPYDGKTVDQIVQEAHAAGVSHLMSIGTTAANAPVLKEIADRFENVFFTVGVHPHDSAEVPDDYLATLESWAKTPKCRGIGEIGLDYYYEHSDRKSQLQRLREQLALARQLALPIVIHSRDGEEDLLRELETHIKLAPHSSRPGVIHCFSGTESFAQRCLDLGFFISFSGILTFKKSQELRRIAQAIPLDRVLIETDAPFLAPEPLRGKKCEPAMVVHTAAKLAQIHGVTFEEVATATTHNAKTLFNLH